MPATPTPEEPTAMSTPADVTPYSSVPVVTTHPATAAPVAVAVIGKPVTDATGLKRFLAFEPATAVEVARVVLLVLATLGWITQADVDQDAQVIGALIGAVITLISIVLTIVSRARTVPLAKLGTAVLSALIGK